MAYVQTNILSHFYLPCTLKAVGTGYFLICIVLFIIVYIELPSCSSSFLVGENRMPRAVSDMAIGYDHANDAVLLLGGYEFDQHFAVFKDNNFTDHGSVFTYDDGVQGNAQFYTQLSNTLWMLNREGTEIHAFDINTYQMLPISPSITVQNTETMALSTACLASIDDYLIVVGGGFYDILDTVQIYHLTDHKWLSNTASLNGPRTYAACITANNKVYAMGGVNDNLDDLDSIEVLDVSHIANTSTSWYFFGCTLQQRRYQLRAALYGTDMIYVVGGETLFRAWPSVDIINTVTDECLVADDLNFDVTGAPPIIVQNTLFVFGGFIRDLVADDRYQYLSLPTSNSTPVTPPPSQSPAYGSTINPTKRETSDPTHHPSIIPTSDPVPEPITTGNLTIHPTSSINQTLTLATTLEPRSTALRSTASLASVSPTYTPSTNENKEGEVRDLASTLNAFSEETPEKETKLHIDWIMMAVVVGGVFICFVCLLGVSYWLNRYTKNVKGQQMHADAIHRKDGEDMMGNLTVEGNGEFIVRCDSDHDKEDDEVLEAVNQTIAAHMGANVAIDEFVISNDSDAKDMAHVAGASQCGYSGGNQAKPPVDCSHVQSMIDSLNKVPLALLVTKRGDKTSGENDQVLGEIEGDEKTVGKKTEFWMKFRERQKRQLVRYNHGGTQGTKTTKMKTTKMTKTKTTKTTICSNTIYSERNARVVKQITKGDAIDDV
eukprot:105887_1